MKSSFAAPLVLLLLATPALANKPPLFAAQCAGGTNAGGYNIDTDTEGHVWINGTKTVPKAVNATYWIAKTGGVEVEISNDASGLMVTFTGKHGANGICPVISQ